MNRRKEFWATHAKLWLLSTEQWAYKLLAVLGIILAGFLSLYAGHTADTQAFWERATISGGTFLLLLGPITLIEMWFKGGDAGARLMDQLNHPNVPKVKSYLWKLVRKHKDTVFGDSDYHIARDWHDEIAVEIGKYLGEFEEEKFREKCCGFGQTQKGTHFNNYKQDTVNYVNELVNRLTQEQIEFTP